MHGPDHASNTSRRTPSKLAYAHLDTAGLFSESDSKILHSRTLSPHHPDPIGKPAPRWGQDTPHLIPELALNATCDIQHYLALRRRSTVVTFISV